MCIYESVPKTFFVFSAADYLEIIKRLKEVLNMAGKKVKTPII